MKLRIDANKRKMDGNGTLRGLRIPMLECKPPQRGQNPCSRRPAGDGLSKPSAGPFR